MDHTEMYRHLLGLEQPWTVERVDMDVARQEVVVSVGHPAGTRFCCPQCDRQLAVFDHAAERRWRHLDTCQFMTFLTAKPPRVDCPDHGKLQVNLPWAESGSRFTNMFEALAIEVLQAANIKRAAQLLRVTWDEAWGVMRRAVDRGLAAKTQTAPRLIGVDEKAISKGHRYMTLVCDLEASTVEYIGEERTQASLAAYYASLAPAQRGAIEAVSMDMWEPYVKATIGGIDDARDKIVFDRFHIMQNVLRALDLVRRAENRDLRADGDSTLLRTKYLWLRSQENVPAAAVDDFSLLRSMKLKTARAWAMRERLRQLWSEPNYASAMGFWKKWYFWATHSRL